MSYKPISRASIFDAQKMVSLHSRASATEIAILWNKVEYVVSTAVINDAFWQECAEKVRK